MSFIPTLKSLRQEDCDTTKTRTTCRDSIQNKPEANKKTSQECMCLPTATVQNKGPHPGRPEHLPPQVLHSQLSSSTPHGTLQGNAGCINFPVKSFAVTYSPKFLENATIDCNVNVT